MSTKPSQMSVANNIQDDLDLTDNLDDILEDEFLNENKIINYSDKKIYLQNAAENYTEIGWISLLLGIHDKKNEGKAPIPSNWQNKT